MRLAVKQRESMFGQRPSDFYERLAGNSSVFFVSLSETITGTAGWEAIIRASPPC
jgi:hypothetical protein